MNKCSIGYVLSVKGNQIDVILDNNVASDIVVYGDSIVKIGQIGSLVKISIGYVSLIGIITSINLNERIKDEVEKEYSNYRHAEVLLLGEISGNHFEKGITQFPLTKDEVFLLTNDELEIIHLLDRNVYPLRIGHLSSNDSIQVMVDMNKLISRHSIVIGATGTGKSNAVTVILKEISSKKELEASRIFVIDPHGEYSKVVKDDSKVFKIRSSTEMKDPNIDDLFVPFWAIDFYSLLDLFYNNLNENQLSMIAELVLERKVNSAKKTGDNPGQFTIDTPYPFSLKNLWYELDRNERRTLNNRGTDDEALVKEGNPDKLISAKFKPPGFGSSAPFIDNNLKKGIQSFLDSIRAKLLDPRYNFMFHPGDYTPNDEGVVKSDLDSLLFSWFGHDKKITIIDLSNIPSYTHHIIVGTILNIVYNSLTLLESPVNGKDFPMLIVLEEAHSYFGDTKSRQNVARNVIERISKEGRKYGAGLMMITQRPSEIGDTIISQMGTMMCLRLNNPKDKAFINGAIDSDMESITKTLSTLRTGEAIIMGESVKIPCKVKYYLKNEGFSSDPVISQKWKSQKPDLSKYSEMLSILRNSKGAPKNE